MDFAAIYMVLWFALFPRSFGRHLSVIIGAMRDALTPPDDLAERIKGDRHD